MPALDRAVLAALILCLPRAAGAASSADDSHWATDPSTHCALFDATLRPGDTVNWIGECRDGRAEGPGTASFFNNGAEFESFTGNFVGGVAQDGHVTVRWGNGWSYEGNMVAGHFDGQGMLVNDKKDRFEGAWKDGKLNGTGSVIHAGGERYDGEWKDDLPNGHGVLTRADGTRLEGEFANGKFVTAAAGSGAPAALPVTAASTASVSKVPASVAPASMTQASSDQAAPGTQTMADNTAPPDKPVSDKQSDEKPADAVKPMLSTPTSALSPLSGKKLLAVDGAALNLTAIDGGIERDITSAGGTLEKTTFTFINDRLGTVAADGGTGAANVTGFFRLTDNGVEVRYADGRGEILAAKDDGVLLRLETPGAAAACRSFYPSGHVFSEAEKKAAVAAYANRLGLATASDVKSTCPGDVAQTPQQAAPDAKARAPEHHADARRPAKATPASLRAAPATPSNLAATVTEKMAALAPVTVKDSVVHAVDGMPPLPATVGEIAAIAAPAAGSVVPGQHDASHCLTVESDGLHWGFRNACNFDVQFAYCLARGGDNLTACGGTDNTSGSVVGSVPAKGFGALLADKSFGEKDAEHDFRWLACDGGAGEVVAHLDRIDPPSGRCVRANDLASK